MATTTFGYDAIQDRLWMRSHQPDFTIWFTRRLVARMFGPILRAFVDQTPGADSVSLPAQRVAIEHQLALHESAPGRKAPYIKPSQVRPGDDADPQQRLCLRITATASAQNTQLNFETAAGSISLNLSRQGTHVWLRGLTMTLRNTQWDLPADLLPHWLQADLLPEPVRQLVHQATEQRDVQSAPPPATRPPSPPAPLP